jgi:hypothetical protein
LVSRLWAELLAGKEVDFLKIDRHGRLQRSFQPLKMGRFQPIVFFM